MRVYYFVLCVFLSLFPHHYYGLSTNFTYYWDMIWIQGSGIMILSTHLVLSDSVVYSSRGVIICSPLLGVTQKETGFCLSLVPLTISPSCHLWEVFFFFIPTVTSSLLTCRGIYLYIQISVKCLCEKACCYKPCTIRKLN